MTYKLEIKSHVKKYHVEINNNIILSRLVDYDLIICDDFFKSRFKDTKVNKIFIKSFEKNKNMNYAIKLMEKMRDLQINKSSKILVIGGGIAQDLGTFLSSVYMRGLNWNYAPTTLTSILDSCIGGKSSLNLGKFKNLIGNFYPPNNIIIDTSFIKTLNNLEIISGLAEAIKICYAKDHKSFEKFLKLSNEFNVKNHKLNEQLIYHVLTTKKFFIEKDEFDLGIRKKLNFGHSYAHAIEASTNFKIPHGIAVLIGIIAASLHDDAFKNKKNEKFLNECLKLSRSIKKFILTNMSNLNYENFTKNLMVDKKNSNEKFILILPSYKNVEITSYPKTKINYLKTYNALKKGLKLINEN